MDMPPDPCLPADEASFGSAMHILYTSLLAGGFPDRKATEITAMVVFMMSTWDSGQPPAGQPQT